MNTGRRSIDKQLDVFVQQGKNATYMDFKTMPMFYPPIQYEIKDKTPLLKRIIKSISHYFSLRNKVQE